MVDARAHLVALAEQLAPEVDAARAALVDLEQRADEGEAIPGEERRQVNAAYRAADARLAGVEGEIRRIDHHDDGSFHQIVGGRAGADSDAAEHAAELDRLGHPVHGAPSVASHNQRLSELALPFIPEGGES